MKVLFVTGKLADRALRETLEAMRPDFEYDVSTLRISVAALLTTPLILRALKPDACDLIMIPGLCQAEPDTLTEAFGVQVEKGPRDLRDIPYHFGVERKREGFGQYTIQILAEINDAPLLSTDEILRKAKYYQTCGADIIDVGCTPGRTADNVEEIVSQLKAEGFTVSVDTFNEKEIRQADKAGVDFLLSLNGQNIHLAPELNCTPVVIPDFGAGIESLERNIEALERVGVTRYLVDPILDPVNFGFSRSLHRLYEVRERYPQAEMLIGVGNLTELFDADSTGINALMVGVMTELDIRYVLTTEVAHWTRGTVRELDRARRLMHYARTQGVLPKDIDDSLLTIKDRKVDWPTEEEVRDLQRRVTDPNFRIMIDGKNIYCFNRDLFVKDTDIQRIFHQITDQLGTHPTSHAFYLGRELAKADIALRLGKKYIQEEDLDWGYLNHGLPGD
ncbi:MAG: DUF6513 domain-containing protein [Candidatus Methylomirabilales bacterium]